MPKQKRSKEMQGEAGEDEHGNQEGEKETGRRGSLRGRQDKTKV